jgi:hypothetical protein
MNMFGGVALLVGIFTLFMLRRLQLRNTDEIQKHYQQFCKKMAKVGFERAPHEGAQDFANRATGIKSQYATAIQNITAQYIALRYQNQHDASLLQSFKSAVRSFKL